MYIIHIVNYLNQHISINIDIKLTNGKNYLNNNLNFKLSE